MSGLLREYQINFGLSIDDASFFYDSSAVLGKYSADNLGYTMDFYKSRSATIGTYTPINSGDELGSIRFFGVNTTSAIVLGASHRVVVDGTPGASFIPTRQEFWTGTNAAAPVLGVTINSIGLSIGSSAATSSQLYINTNSGPAVALITANGITSDATISLTGRSASSSLTMSTASGSSLISSGSILSISTNAGTRAVTIDASQNVILNSASTVSALTVNSLTPQFQIQGTTNASSSQLNSQYSNDATGPVRQTLKSRGTTVGALAAVSSSDVLAQHDFYGVNTTPAIVLGASHRVIVDGTPGASFIPTRQEFWTGTNAAAAKVALSINSLGNVLVNTNVTDQTAYGQLQIVNTNSASITAASIVQYTNDSFGPAFYFGKSRGTAQNTWSIISSGDVLGSLIFGGGTNLGVANVGPAFPAQIVATASANWVNSATVPTSPSQLSFYTGGAAAANYGLPQLAMTLDSLRNMTVVGAATATTHGTTAFSAGTLGSSATISWLNGGLQTATLTAATTTVLTFTAPASAGCFLVLRITQAGTPTGLITWPSSVLFYPTAFQQATPGHAGITTEFLMYWDGTNYSVIKSVVQSSALFNTDNAFLYAGDNISAGLNFGKINGTSGSGSYIGWNFSGSNAEMDFVNQSANATGGFAWYKSDGSTLTSIATLSAASSLNISSILLSPGISFPGAATSGQAYNYSSTTLGYVIYGNGSTNDVTIANRAGTTAISVAGNTVNVSLAGTLSVVGNTTALNVVNTMFNIGTVTTTCAINWSTNGCIQNAIPTNATACTISFTAPPGPCEFTFKLIGPASGTSGVFTWPTASFKGSTAGLSTVGLATGKVSIFFMYYDGTSYWLQSSQIGV